MKVKSILFLLLTAAVLVSCASPFSAGPPTAEPNLVPSTVIPTFTAPPPFPTVTVVPTAAPTPTSFIPFEISMTVDHANVRSNPGILFSVINTVAKGTRFQVLGKAPGGEWFLVQAADGTQGWVFGQITESTVDLQSAPVIMPANVQIFEGRIYNDSGQPVSGIQFAFTQDAYGKQLRNDGNSDENGIFLVFMPPDVSGEWAVSYTAISCTSNTMDDDCNCRDGICGNVAPATQTFTLPQKEPVIFTWVYAR
jgi:uncharacterized protein YgiM (DUF1202 family)